MTEHTHFAVGSTTKAFTAAGISFLVEDNEKYPHIQWNSPVHSIIPDDFALSDDWYTTHVTISDALSHHSGLPRHDMTWAFNTSSPREAVRKLRHLPITEPIRTKWMYNNMMYIAMGHLISSVTGQTLGDFFRTHIWEPLGMHETYISFAEAQAARPEVVISKGYYTSRNGSRIDVGDYDLQGCQRSREHRLLSSRLRQMAPLPALPFAPALSIRSRTTHTSTFDNRDRHLRFRVRGIPNHLRVWLGHPLLPRRTAHQPRRQPTGLLDISIFPPSSQLRISHVCKQHASRGYCNPSPRLRTHRRPVRDSRS